MADMLVPGFELDALAESTLTAPVIVPMAPANGETKVPLDAGITFAVVDADGTADAGAVAVTLNGSPVAFTTTATPDAATLLLSVTVPADFISDSVNTVEVTYTGGTPTPTVVEWSFRADDVTPPGLVSVIPQSPTVLRVTWDDTVLQANPAAVDDALNPNNYYIERTQAPTVTVQVVSVNPGPLATQVDVVVDIPMTFGSIYRLGARNVVDECGNEVVAPNDVAVFSAFAPAFPEGRQFLLWEFIPLVNRCEDATGDLRKWISVLQEVVNCLLYEIDRFATILDPDNAPDAVLDRMICDLGRPAFIDACGTLTTQAKRRLISVLVQIYKRKGTAPGMVEVVRLFLGIDIEVKPYNDPTQWWQLGVDELGEDGTDGTAILGPSGRELYSFEVCALTALTDDQRTCIFQIVDYMRPAHTHFVRLLEPGEAVGFVPDHWEIGLSELGSDTTDGTAILHE